MSQLRFRPDGQFTIVQFTDLHLRNGDDLDLRTQSLMEHILGSEHPDLVVLTGDVIDGAQCSDPARSWREATAPMRERGIFWAAVFGNHDDEGSLDRRQLMSVQQECPFCLSQPGPENLAGVGNYWLDILSSSGDSPAAQLHFLDSGGLSPDHDAQYAWITRQQIEWCLSNAGIMQLAGTHVQPAIELARRSTPSLVFFHIPIPEFDEASRTQHYRGSKLEDVCCPQFNSGFFAALRSAGNVLGVFVGHDHLNDFEVELDGIRLCYGRASGYGGYGQDGFPRGARVIRLTEAQRVFHSWVRLDDGTVHGDLHGSVLT